MPSDHVSYLIVGAGISGLAFANFIPSDDYLILEREPEVGGWCKTIRKDGFIWDFSGHFFHFRHPEIEAYLRGRLPQDEVVTVLRDSRVLYKGHWVDFPFQKNIHQLPKEEFVECLTDLYFRQEDGQAQQAAAPSFKSMLYEKFGQAISEKFLVPYNEKLYACELDELDREAMGRFFPYADLDAVMRNMRAQDSSTYNSTFTYPRHGAIMYVQALMRDLAPEKVCLGEGVESVDLGQKRVLTSKGRTLTYDHLISSAPFDKLLAITGLPQEEGTFSYNKVLVFNLGFDKKGLEQVHWVYFPEKSIRFYRVGFYDNILNTDRMSLYVEIGYPAQAAWDTEAELERVLHDLRASGIVTDQELVSWHSIMLDPAYVHITSASKAAFERLHQSLSYAGVHSIGRYGGWTYCSIEDNIVEARALAKSLGTLDAVRGRDDVGKRQK